LTRRLNLVADKALLAAFAQGTHNVSLDHVKAAVRDSEFSNAEPPRGRTPVTYALAGLALGGALGVAAFAAYQALTAPKAQVVPTAATPSQLSQATPEAIVVATAPAAPTTAGPANSAPTPEATTPSDVLEQRLLATDQWLGEQSSGFYSIQLLGTGDAELLREYFKTIAKYVEIEKVYVYRTTANRRPSLTVLYGTFATRDEVTRTLQSLPEELKFNRPYYRTIQGIRAEIAQKRS
jgi:septal ring-binding cell division protein DamX